MGGGSDIVGWLAEKLGYRHVVYYNSQAIISRYQVLIFYFYYLI